ncbi:phenylalanyl-tRNA synthetase alpha chain [Chaetoceros tenuissimus]|uniref:Phenylalanine--tRNA ligase alpha subunit n=1 Tax=Chaetoceros tenuissimus TaxID=426638 RepID=A0AAD3CMF5_9STRA|nr:phenylalanyl-tRNA synthetase alpha chain [Chaetoceros tenuissimus]
MMLKTAFVMLSAAQMAAGFSMTGNRNLQNKNSLASIIEPQMKVSSTSLFMADTETVSIEDITAELNQHKQDFDAKVAAAESAADIDKVRVEYLGKKGPINKVMSYMRLLPNEDKPKLGAVVNQVKGELESVIATKKEEMQGADIENEMKAEAIDVTMPGLKKNVRTGRRHPLSITMEKAVDIFTALGYDTVTEAENSPEIETDYYCFEALNCPKDHPARDMQDTFYLTEDMGHLLRTHTSAVQIRQLGKRKPPLRIVAPGRVYRKDDIDATHSMIFHQIEILALDEKGKLNLGHLKGTVEHFLNKCLDLKLRGKWLEVLGCGMVDPNVLEMAGIDPNEYSGFAAGFGVERFAMVIHQINDIREFYKNDIRFLDQFPSFHDEGLTSLLNGDVGREQEEVNIKTVESAVAETEAKPEKKEKKKKQAPAPAGDIDVSKLDIRVGVITKAWLHEEADKLFCEEIDLGEEEGPRQIASGLRAHYNLEDLEGQRVLVLANLKTRKLVGFPSHGMVMCAASEDGSKVEFIEPPADAKIGERVMIEGFDGEPATENQVIKKKMLDKIFPDLSTNSEGVATYKGVVFNTSAGPCVAQKKMPNSPVG